MTSSTLSTIALATLLLALGACGKKDAPDTSASSEQAAGQAATRRTANGLELDQYGAILLPRQPLLPFARYTVLDQSKNFRTRDQAETTQVEALYRKVFWSGNAFDADLLAYDLLPDVRAEKDAFKRADIVQARRVELDAAYADAQKQKHYALYLDRDYLMSIGPYDAQKKGYLIHAGLPEGNAYGWSKPKEHDHNEHATWMVDFAGSSIPEESSWYIPKDEAEARALEGKLSTLRGDPATTLSLPGYYLGHTADAASRPRKGQYAAILVVDGVTLVDPATRQPLLTLDYHARQPKATVRDDDIKRALQPEAKPAS